MGNGVLTPRDLARAGIFGAAAIALPFLFHLLHLGAVFMPMYLPLMALPFFAGPVVAAVTALVVPLISALLTGMPPWYPPVAPMMAVELMVMAGLASWLWRRWGRSVLAILVISLLTGRLLMLVGGYVLGLLLNLPPEFLSMATVAAGLPGLLLMLVVIPPFVRIVGDEPAVHSMRQAAIQQFFDERAESWDDKMDVEAVGRELRKDLQTLEVGAGETVADIGSGTGVLTGVLLDMLGPQGRVHAVDLSPKMAEVLRAKHEDERLTVHVADAADLPVQDGLLDHVLVFSTWPHILRKDATLEEARRTLRPGGRIAVWHAVGRKRINEIHRHAGSAVRRDLLEPAKKLAARMEKAGFEQVQWRDDDQGYRVTARAPENASA